MGEGISEPLNTMLAILFIFGIGFGLWFAGSFIYLRLKKLYRFLLGKGKSQNGS